jgi:monovalent cation:H+ antiporter-2, CPA2 family
MHDQAALIAILTIGFALATVLAYLAQRLKLPSILGYLLAGYIIGPYSPGFVADISIAEQLAELGIILMLFGVGLHFKLQDLINVKNVAIPGAIGQTLASTLLATALMYAAGWSLQSGVIIGLAVGVASTVVLVRVLSDNHILNTREGHIAIGWLVVEDIFTVIILILLPAFAAMSDGDQVPLIHILGSIAMALVKFVFLAYIMFTWGHKVISYLLLQVARLRSQELFTSAVLAVILLVAAGSAVVFGTSIALGAFIAGMVIAKTAVKHQAAANAVPLKDVFTIIFFLSVGMLFNPMAIATQFPLFIGILSIILVGKPLVAYLITTCLGYSLKVGLTVAIALAQIGEFSFILAEQAMKLRLLPDEGFDILVACALVSISLNPILFQLISSFESKLKQWPLLSRLKSKTLKSIERSKVFSPKAVIVGYGPIGKAVSAVLREAGFVPSIIESNIDTVTDDDEKNQMIFGDASKIDILKDAHIEEASYLLITIPDANRAVEIIDAARQAKPDIRIIARIQYVAERPLLSELHVDYICAESEALQAFVSHVHALLAYSSLPRRPL